MRRRLKTTFILIREQSYEDVTRREFIQTSGIGIALLGASRFSAFAPKADAG